MARRNPPRKVTYFEPVPPRLARNTIIEFDLRGRSPLPLHDARRLWPARPRRGDPAGTRRMAPAHARAPRRRRACGLARRPRCGLSARRTDHRHAPRGRRRINRAQIGVGGGNVPARAVVGRPNGLRLAGECARCRRRPRHRPRRLRKPSCRTSPRSECARTVTAGYRACRPRGGADRRRDHLVSDRRRRRHYSQDTRFPRRFLTSREKFRTRGLADWGLRSEQRFRRLARPADLPRLSPRG